MSEEIETPDVVDAATEAAHEVEAETPEELPPGVSKTNMTRDEAKAAMGEFLAHVGIVGADGQPVEVTVQEPVVVTGEHERIERPEYVKLAEEQRAAARIEGAQHADIEVSEALDEPITLAATLETLDRLLEQAQKAVALLRKTDAWAQRTEQWAPLDTSDEL